LNGFSKEELGMAQEKPSLEKIIGHIQSYLEVLEKEKLPIERVFLFGSHAKKKARQWSDIDICIISPKFRDRCHAIDYLWKKRGAEDVEHGIAPVGFHPKDFIDEDPLAWEIKTTGIEIQSNKHRKSMVRLYAKLDEAEKLSAAGDKGISHKEMMRRVRARLKNKITMSKPRFKIRYLRKKNSSTNYTEIKTA
jgi:predicted nucleotidyltransferase